MEFEGCIALTKGYLDQQRVETAVAEKTLEFIEMMQNNNIIQPTTFCGSDGVITIGWPWNQLYIDIFRDESTHELGIEIAQFSYSADNQESHSPTILSMDEFKNNYRTVQ